MTYENIPVRVEAMQVIVRVSVDMGRETGPFANPGEWIVKHADGKVEVLTDKNFRAKFRPIQLPPSIRSIAEGMSNVAS